MSLIIGIDLGTTNCCVAIADGPKARVIENKLGYKTTPSVIAVTEDGARVVGQIALRQTITNPEHTIQASKRLIGRRWDASEVQRAIENSPFEIVAGPQNDARVVLRGREFSIPELAAMLLQEMRLVAEEDLGEAVHRAVVTVPAYFGDAQRQAVRDAGKIAGLEVVRILNEPTAAAVAYGFGKETDRVLAVYDLGGGTFDISIVRVSKGGEFQVVATTGDSYLGGEDFDQILVNALLNEVQTQYDVDLRNSPVALSRVKEAARKAKVELSALDMVAVQLPFLITEHPEGPKHLNTSLFKKDFEKGSANLVSRTIAICQKAMNIADMEPSDIDDVILIGGMTRMPAVQAAVQNFFQSPPRRDVHPDEAVALGAALVGSSLGEHTSEVVLHDVTAHALGLMTAGGLLDILIPSNTPVPHQINELFTTSKDNQQQVKIVVLQAPENENDAPLVLTRFALSGIRPAPAGTLEIEVRFRIDNDGIFSVTAKNLETGQAQSIEVLASSGIADEELERMIDEGTEYLAERRADENVEGERQACEMLIRQIGRLRAKLPKTIPAEVFSEAERTVVAAQHDLETGDLSKLRSHTLELSRLSSLLERLSG